MFAAEIKRSSFIHLNTNKAMKITSPVTTKLCILLFCILGLVVSFRLKEKGG